MNQKNPVPPFFIVGAGRSGTTLLRLMLCGSGELFVPPEAWFFGRVISELPHDRPLGIDDLGKIEQICVEDSRWKDWSCARDKLHLLLVSCRGLKLDAVLDALFRGVFDLPPHVRWGEKTPRHSHIALRIAEVFPRCQFVHLLRDGRDVSSSMLARGWYDGSARRVAEHWSGCVEGAARAQSCGSLRYLEVRFEKLLFEPKVQMERICQFLGIDYDDRMLMYSQQVDRLIPAGEAGFHGKLSGGLETREIGKWHRVLSPWQEAVFWSVARATMKKYYPGEAIRLPARVLLPVAMLSVAVGRAWSRLRATMRGLAKSRALTS
jgi:hypothetical protein